MNILYLHGLEGGPDGTKGTWCQETWGAIAPKMPAKRDPNTILDINHITKPSCFEQCYDIARTAVEIHQPALIIGSSFGGAITQALIARQAFRGACILLAPAGGAYDECLTLPDDCHAIVIHDPNDDLIAYRYSEKFAASNQCKVELWPSDGGHKLRTIITNGLLNDAIERQLSRVALLPEE